MAASSSSSPSISPPSLLQSSFSSTTDTPPTPHTPPRGRSRYPSSLAHDGLRVPLHRRGTSKTYERLEDLLKEAGYKETRVFTPETERHRGHELVHGEARQNDGKLRNGVDAVVGLLAGLVLGPAHGQPTDPRAPRSDQVGQATLMVCIDRVANFSHPSGSTARTSLSQIRGAPRHPPTSSRPPDSGPQPNVHASPARAYLRHIASAPNIPRRRFHGEHASTPVAKRSTTSLKDDHYTQHSPQPPMPPSWLGTVARAVLGFPGARIGGPNVKRPNSPLEDTAARLRGRSTPSLPTSSDLLQPPTLPTMRSQVSPGQVVRINVVCRSAPASRSSSVVGRKLGSDSLASSCLGDLSNGSTQKQGRLADSGPSLRDRLEDIFSLHSPGDGDDYDLSSEDEDEGEVDLSKLLVHVRRQRSIKSLQRHLQRASKPHGRDKGSSNVAETWTLHGGDGSAAAYDASGRIRRGSVNDSDWGVSIAPGPGRDSRSFNRRREIPVSWTQQGSSSRK
ncbi:hypothetical protein BJV77DRAFT_1002741 [Russula vinacea]|nr:hypothetical protein BJV77DRAFT_1002741 [Russula vinacea]